MCDVQTEYEGQAKKYMDVVEQPDAIVTVGGDGTVSEVITSHYRFGLGWARFNVPIDTF